MKLFTITCLLILTILGSTGFAVEEHVLMLDVIGNQTMDFVKKNGVGITIMRVIVKVQV